MSLHFCPDELAAIMLFIENVQLYYFHYKHVVMSWVGQRKHDPCQVCEDDE